MLHKDNDTYLTSDGSLTVNFIDEITGSDAFGSYKEYSYDMSTKGRTRDFSKSFFTFFNLYDKIARLREPTRAILSVR